MSTALTSASIQRSRQTSHLSTRLYQLLQLLPGTDLYLHKILGRSLYFYITQVPPGQLNSLSSPCHTTPETLHNAVQLSSALSVPVLCSCSLDHSLFSHPVDTSAFQVFKHFSFANAFFQLQFSGFARLDTRSMLHSFKKVMEIPLEGPKQNSVPGSMWPWQRLRWLERDLLSAAASIRC